MTQFTFKRTSDDDYPRHLKALVQGPPKSGKTTFLATAPHVVVAACEAGLMSIAHLDIPYVEIDSTDKLQRLEMVLRDESLRAQAAAHNGLPRIETVAIDTVDAWQEILKREILAENHRSQMQRDDWATLKERMAAVLKRFVTLPLNVIFTVHSTTTQDEEQRLIYAPALQGAIKDEIAGYVDFSLLAYRQRETDRDGLPRINYYLKCEGDTKNPHLGNRAAGRLPEVCVPKFELLQDAVFGNRPTTVITEAAGASSTARTSSHAPAAAKPTGVPKDDTNKPINASGIAVLTKSYTEHALVVPPDLKEWTIDRGRKVAKWFVAWKADKAAGRDTSRDDLIEGLKAFDGFAGELDGVQTGTKNLKTTPKPEPKPAPTTKHSDSGKPTEKNQRPVDAEPKSDIDPAEEAAVALLQEQLGAVVIGREVPPDATCEVCGRPIDDRDIANLGLRRFKKTYCVKDYKKAVAQARA